MVIVSFMSRPGETAYPSDRRLGGLQGWSRRYREVKNRTPVRNRTPAALLNSYVSSQINWKDMWTVQFWLLEGTTQLICNILIHLCMRFLPALVTIKFNLPSPCLWILTYKSILYKNVGIFISTKQFASLARAIIAMKMQNINLVRPPLSYLTI
jgi:hypothetical protein